MMPQQGITGSVVYNAAVKGLLEPVRLAELGPGTPNEAARSRLSSLRVRDLVEKVEDAGMAAACLAGLWLYHDFLDESHHISQDLHTAEGRYWHALMHRREPDYDNSKYWFRNVGRHVIFEQLAGDAAQLATEAGIVSEQAVFLRDGREWRPAAFVDLCQAAAQREDELAMLCRRIQHREWQLLFDHCYRRAGNVGPA